MILITHPRCGSEWFLKSLPDKSYSGWEIISDMHRIVGTVAPIFKNIPIAARVRILECRRPEVAHKIHVHNLRREEPGIYWERLLVAIKKHDDVYLLERRNVRQTAISYLVAVHNSWNFHEDNSLIKTPFAVTKAELELVMNKYHLDLDWTRTLFSYKEEFVYEDLMSGVQVPNTVRWDPKLSPIKQRKSTERFSSLITNYDEMIQLMDELKMPGEL